MCDDIKVDTRMISLKEDTGGCDARKSPRSVVWPGSRVKCYKAGRLSTALDGSTP